MTALAKPVKRVRRIGLHIEGWCPCHPVSIDKLTWLQREQERGESIEPAGGPLGNR